MARAVLHLAPSSTYPKSKMSLAKKVRLRGSSAEIPSVAFLKVYKLNWSSLAKSSSEALSRVDLARLIKSWAK